MLVNEGDLSVAKACAGVGVSRRAWNGAEWGTRQLKRIALVIDDLNGLVDKHPR